MSTYVCNSHCPRMSASAMIRNGTRKRWTSECFRVAWPHGTRGWPEDGVCDVLGQLLYTVG